MKNLKLANRVKHFTFHYESGVGCSGGVVSTTCFVSYNLKIDNERNMTLWDVKEMVILDTETSHFINNIVMAAFKVIEGINKPRFTISNEECAL